MMVSERQPIAAPARSVARRQPAERRRAADPLAAIARRPGRDAPDDAL